MSYKAEVHNKFAPYWAATLIVVGVIGVSTTWFKFGGFWNAYVLDICGPGWNYILFRLLFTEYRDNRWRRFFNPVRTVVIFIVFSFGVETAQFLELYESTFDPFDYLAYISLLLPLFIIDQRQQKKAD